MTGGTLNSPAGSSLREVLGVASGSGVFTQSGGVNVPFSSNGGGSYYCNSLQLGYSNGGYGEYDMSGGTRCERRFRRWQHRFRILRRLVVEHWHGHVHTNRRIRRFLRHRRAESCHWSDGGRQLERQQQRRNRGSAASTTSLGTYTLGATTARARRSSSAAARCGC